MYFFCKYVNTVHMGSNSTIQNQNTRLLNIDPIIHIKEFEKLQLPKSNFLWFSLNLIFRFYMLIQLFFFSSIFFLFCTLCGKFTDTYLRLNTLHFILEHMCKINRGLILSTVQYIFFSFKIFYSIFYPIQGLFPLHLGASYAPRQ